MSVFGNWGKNNVTDSNESQTIALADAVAEDLSNEIKRRTPKESEDDLLAPYVDDMGYRAQVSTITHEDGTVEERPYGEKGTRRPDATRFETNENGEQRVEAIVEVKNYNVTNASGKNNLANNISKQTQSSYEAYGNDIKITEVIDLRGQNVTIDDLTKLTEKLEEKVPDVGLDYRW